MAAAGLSLAACEPVPRTDAWHNIRERAEIVRECASGAVVLRDPKTGKLYWRRMTALSESAQPIETGKTPAEVCA